MLVCDELLSNAMVHAGGVAIVSLSASTEYVRVAVSDRQTPDATTFGRFATPYSGLTLIRQLSREVYLEETGDGKSVTAEIARYPADTADDDPWTVRPSLPSAL